MQMPGEDEIEAMQAHKENLRQRETVRKALKENNGVLKKY